MSERYRPLAHYLREAAGLTSERFLKEHQHPVLLWPQGRNWIEDTPFQFETYTNQSTGDRPQEVRIETDSQIGETLVIEISKQVNSCSTRMICVGRASNNDIVLANNTVSKLHAYFLQAGDHYEIADASSTNGTRVNDRRLQPYQNQPLANRDRVQFGPSIHVLYLTPQGFYDFLQGLQRSGIV